MGILLTQVTLSNAVNVTFTQLGNLITTNKISSGKVYRVSDWKSTYKLQNGLAYILYQANEYSLYSTDFGINDPATPLAPYSSEPLYFIGLSGNRVSSQCYSELFPYDEIYFEFDFTGPGNTVNMAKSRITFRQDPIMGIKSYYDQRQIKFPRFNFKLYHKVTHTITNDFVTVPLHQDTSQYSGISESAIDYNTHYKLNYTVGYNKLLETQALKTIETFPTPNNLLYDHYYTFGYYNPTNVENVTIDKQGNSDSYFADIGSNVVFYNGAKNVTISDSEDMTIIDYLSNSNITNSSQSIFYGDKITGSLNDTIGVFDNLIGDITKTFIDKTINFSNNKFDLVNGLIIHNQSTNGSFSNNTISEITECYIGNVDLTTNTNEQQFNYNVGLILKNTHFWVDADRVITYPKMNTIDTFTFTNQSDYNQFNHNHFVSLQYSSIEANFFNNSIDSLYECIIQKDYDFFENQIMNTQLTSIDFGSKVIYGKIKDNDYSTFEKVIYVDRIDNTASSYTPSNALYFDTIGPFKLNITDDEFQYIGIFYVEYLLTDYSSNGNQTIFYVDSINTPTVQIPTHKIMFKTKENSTTGFNQFLVFRNTEAMNTDTDNNIMLANTTILPLSEVNRDQAVFFMDGVNLGTEASPILNWNWLQFDAQSYNTFGSGAQSITTGSGSGSGGCCPASDVPYNNLLYTNVQDALDAALYVPMSISNLSITNVQVLVGNNTPNTTSVREVGESVVTFKLNWSTNKPMNRISSFQILIKVNNETTWTNMVNINSTGTPSGFQEGISTTIAPFNNPNNFNFYATIVGNLPTIPITSTSEVKIKVIGLEIDPYTMANEVIETSTKISFNYPIYYDMSLLPITTAQFLNQKIYVEKRSIATQPKIELAEFSISSGSTNNTFIWFAIHEDLLNGKMTTNVSSPLINNSTEVYLPRIFNLNNYDTSWLTTPLTRSNPQSGTTEKYILFRSLYNYDASSAVYINYFNIKILGR